MDILFVSLSIWLLLGFSGFWIGWLCEAYDDYNDGREVVLDGEVIISSIICSLFGITIWVLVMEHIVRFLFHILKPSIDRFCRLEFFRWKPKKLEEKEK